MRILLTILFTLSHSSLCYSQVSKNIDSSMVMTIVQLDSSLSGTFFDLYARAYETDFYSRVDSLAYDYAFADISISGFDTSFIITERYFNMGDSIPRYIFKNGDPYKAIPSIKYTGWRRFHYRNTTFAYTLKPMLKRYQRLKSVQTVPYKRRQVHCHGCIVNENSETSFKETRTEQIKRTCQIQVFVDKRKNRNLVSIQLPPRNPKIKVLGYNSAGDF